MFNKRPDADDADEDATVRGNEPPPRPSPKTTATIGPSICIRGDLTGDEDLIVQGRVEGTVTLTKNLVTIGKDGRINATVNARVIHVEGQVEGDLNGEEQVILQRSGTVQGNITAPRVTLEDGCKFKGSIDMDVSTDGRGKSTGGAKVADLKPAAASGSEDGTKSVLGKTSA